MKKLIAFVIASCVLVVLYIVTEVIYPPYRHAPKLQAASQPASAPSTQPEPAKLVALMPDSPGFYNLEFTVRVGTQYVNKLVTLPCRVFLPRDYDKNNDKRPLLIYLHAEEDRGTNLQALSKVGPEKRLREDQGFRDNARFICVSPQCPLGETWEDDMMAEATARLVEELGARFRVDPDRVSMTGAGMGAAGAWKVAGMNPERFASIAVVSPRGAPSGGEEPRKLRHIYGSVAAAQNDKEGYTVYLATVDGLGKAKADLQFRTNGNNAKECANWYYSDNGTWDWLNNHKRRTRLECAQRDERDAKELAAALAATPKLPGQYKLMYSTWVGDKKVDVPYQLSLPRGYDAAKSSCPTIIFFSGAGEENPDLSAINSHGPCAKMREDPAFREWCPFIVISPIHDNSPERARAIVEMLDDLQKKVRIDPDRVYVTGLSLGGTTTWTVSNAAPEKFAAIVPINGRERCMDVAAKNLKYIKTWIIVGGADGDFFTGSVHMNQILLAAGDDTHLTVIPGEGHNSWPRYYNDRRFYDWLLQQRRLSPTERAARDKYPATEPSKMLADAVKHPDVLTPGHHWLEFATQLGGKPYNLRYSLYLPQGYGAAKPASPLMVYLHHDELRDTDQSLIFHCGSNVDPRRDESAKPAFPMIGLVPQLPHDKQWTDPEVIAMTLGLLNEVAGRVRVDPERVYAVGMQSGAAGVWSLAMQAPNRFAALVTLQGGGMNQPEVSRRLKGIGVRLMAFSRDGGMVNTAKQLTEALTKAGGIDAQFEQFNESQDPNQWSPFYTDPKLVTWLLGHRRPVAAAPTARAS